MKIWGAIEGFRPGEQYNNKNAWGDPFRMNGFTLLLLSAIRATFREKDPTATITIHAGFAIRGHSSKSQHYKGNAGDFHVNTTLSYPEQIECMLEALDDLQVAEKVGFGIYPDWNSPGFHIDDRGEWARWGYIGGKIYFGTQGFAQVQVYAIEKNTKDEGI
jgi:hypothetical protein